MINTLRRKFSLLFSCLILALAVVIKTANIPAVGYFQLKVFDTFQSYHPRTYTEQPVKIIDIDEESLKRLGQWPWPRSVLAELVNQLQAAGAAVVAFDIVFAEPDRTSPRQILPLWEKNRPGMAGMAETLPDHDLLFAEAIAQANVVSSFVLTQQKEERTPLARAGYSYAGNDPKPHAIAFAGAVASLPELEQAAAGNGALNSSPDADGILRRVPILYNLNNQLYPSLAAEALRIAQGAGGYLVKSAGASGEEDFGQDTGITAVKIGQYVVPTDASGRYWVYYTPYVAERYIPAWKVLEPDFDKSLVEGMILLVGTSAAGLKDIRSTPLNPVASGVEVHAQALEQMLTGEFLRRPDWMGGAEILLMLTAGLLLIAVMARLPALWGALFTAAVLGAAFSVSWWVFVKYRMLIDPVTPGIAVLLLYFYESLNRYIGTEKEKRNVRNAFSHYMSPVLVEQLAAQPDKLKLGGEMRNLTVLFCDIRGFTTISEQFDAEGLTTFMNQYLTPMTTVILGKQGTIDKYIGDCIMAFWNAPLDDEAHALHGCQAALEMLKALAVFNQQQAKPVSIGIGLNTGLCCVGNMGSEQRFDYSVLGDDVNLASRLESQSKTYGVSIIIGPATRAQAAGLAALEVDLIQVKGKTKPVTIYTLLGDETLAAQEAFKTLETLWNEVLKHYRAQAWQEAQAAIAACKQHLAMLPELALTKLCELYEKRIAAYQIVPPPAGWVGVYEAESK